MNSRYRRGWFGESHRHYLAAKGITRYRADKLGHHLWSQPEEDTEEVRKKMAKLMRKRTLMNDGSDEQKAEFNKEWSRFMKEEVWDDERRAIVSEVTEAMWKDSEYRDAMVKMNKKLWEDPAYRDVMIKLMKERWEDPEMRARMSEGISDAFDDERKAEYRERMREIGLAHAGEASDRMIKYNKEHAKESSEWLTEHRKDPEFHEKMEDAAKEGQFVWSENLGAVKGAIRDVEGDDVADKFSQRKVKIWPRSIEE